MSTKAGLRVLVVHNAYQKFGGEDAVVHSEVALLQEKGNTVRLFEVSNDDISGVVSKIDAAVSSTCSRKYHGVLGEVIDGFSPDVVHVHNFFPLITPSVYDACIERQVPVVQTLHNYRIICANAIFMRDGKVCEKCLDGSVYNAVRYSCYRGSYIGSYFVARMIRFHRLNGTWKEKVDRFIALTEFSRRKFIESGVPEDKIRVKPNYYSSSRSDISTSQISADSNSEYALYVGRLGEEKGIRTLINAWKKIDFPLWLAGDGELMDMVRGAGNSNIRCLGHVSKEQVSGLMRHASFLVLPSECYEGFPMVIVEAFANELPVVATRLGSMEEIISDRETGLHFERGDENDLADKVRMLIENRALGEKMAHNAYEAFKGKYTEEINYKILTDIYSEAIKRKAADGLC